MAKKIQKKKSQANTTMKPMGALSFAPETRPPKATERLHQCEGSEELHLWCLPPHQELQDGPSEPFPHLMGVCLCGNDPGHLAGDIHLVRVYKENSKNAFFLVEKNLKTLKVGGLIFIISL